MAIQVVHVTNPVAGAEWAYTIPGQYVVSLIGVQATLTVRSAPTSVADSSPNLHNATVNTTSPPTATWQTTGPFGAGGGLAVQLATTSTEALALATNSGAFDTAAFTVEAIVNVASSGRVSFEEVYSNRNPTGPKTRTIFGIDGGGVAARLRVAAANADVFSLGATWPYDAFHHVAVTYSGGTWTPYLDGVAGTAVAGHNIDTTVTLQNIGLLGDLLGAVQWYNGKCAAIAYFGSALSGAQIAAHSSAIATSAAAYQTAVLADSPVALWMFNQTYGTIARTVTLAIQNGAATVATFPVDVPVASPGVYTYSWQTLGPGAATSVDGTTITVPIPAMTLPPGYTVGSNTPDIGSSDQWSQITLWYDDGTGTPNPSGSDPPYLNALLVPNDWQGG